MGMEIDHVFVLTAKGAPEADEFVGCGFTEGSPNRHAGQGSACRRFFFRNAMLEFLWVHDLGEARRGQGARLSLADRTERRVHGASPFGLCLRPSEGSAGASPPFESWRYTPGYLPDGHPGILVSCRSGHIDEPLVFSVPDPAGPDRYPPSRAQPLMHRNGAGVLTGTILHCPNPACPDLVALAAVPGLRVVDSDVNRIELVFDGAKQEQQHRFDTLPLAIRY